MTFPMAVEMRISDTVLSSPPIVHTMVDARLGEMPERRARSALSADAATERPKGVRLSSSASPAATIGATMMMSWSGPESTTLPMVNVPVIGDG